MNFSILGRIAGTVLLAGGLAGCIDVAMDIEVLSETTGRATTTSTMGAEFYAMAKSGMASEGATEGFCQEEGATLTENADGSATCVLTVEGSFAELDLGEGEDGAKFEVVRPGVVRVSFSTAELKGELGTDMQDEETKEMMKAFFEGNAITIRVLGKKVTDTNMDLAQDGKSAETVIPFLALIEGTLELPEELYAVVDTN